MKSGSWRVLFYFVDVKGRCVDLFGNYDVVGEFFVDFE